jgi:hypothetical protein
MGFQGMSAHWIEVKEGKWKMKASVIGFKSISGAHDGENLGQYSVGLLERAGIVSETELKASHLVLAVTHYLSLSFPSR